MRVGVIEKGVPVPSDRSCKYPWADMQPGDSILAKGSYSQKRMNELAEKYGGKWIFRNEGYKHSRVWRVE